MSAECRRLRVSLDGGPDCGCREGVCALGRPLLRWTPRPAERITQLETTGRAFLDAYISASVSDEEGLLSAVDQREWAASWRRVDEAARDFGKVLAAAVPEERG